MMVHFTARGVPYDRRSFLKGTNCPVPKRVRSYITSDDTNFALRYVLCNTVAEVISAPKEDIQYMESLAYDVHQMLQIEIMLKEPKSSDVKAPNSSSAVKPQLHGRGALLHRAGALRGSAPQGN